MSEQTGKIFEYQTKIIERHLDSFGHVNNAVYLNLYEEARWDFITKRGYGLEKVKELKLGPVILNLSVNFKRELLNREDILIRSQTQGMKNLLVSTLKQEIFKSSGELASTALFEIGFFDTLKRKLIPPTEDWRQAIGLS